MMMLGPIWLMLVALCVVGLIMMHSSGSCENGHGKERARGACDGRCGGGGFWKLILLVVGALVLMRVLRVMPSLGHLAAIAAATGVVMLFTRMPTATRRKLVVGGLVVAVGMVVGTAGLVTLSHGGDTIEVNAEDSASMDSFHSHPVHVEHGDDAGHSHLAEHTAWAAHLDAIIAKLERSKGHPPIAALLGQMRELRSRLNHLDAQIADPNARRELSEKLSEAMSALAESVDVLQRMDQHELTDRVRDEIERWDDLLEDTGDVELGIEVPVRPTINPNPIAIAQPSSTAVSQGAVLDRNKAWRPEAEAAFEADIYPDVESASRSLARAVAVLMDGGLIEDRSSPLRVVIGGRANEIEPDIGFILAETLRDRFEGARVAIAADDLAVEMADVRITLDHEVKSQGFDATSIIRATVVTSNEAHGEHRRTTRYIDKPWLTGFDAYVSARPGQSLFLARSALAHTREEAANQAVMDAVAQVKPMVMDYLAQHSSIARESDWRQWADGWLNDHLANSVREGWIVADRFAQRLDFPTAGGDQWREAILIRVDAKNLSALEGFARAQFHTDRNLYQAQAVMQRRETMTEGAAAVGLVVLLLGVYVFLQLSTRGYYKWTVRLTMLVLIVIALAGMYRLSSQSSHIDHGSFVPSQAEFGSPYSH